MNRVLISVEGQTEETFVKDNLRDYLSKYHVYPIPVIVDTKKVKRGNKFKGGVISYGHAKVDILNLLKDTNAVAVTTLYDFYHLPSDFPGYNSLSAGTCYQRVSYLETALRADISDVRFHPYLQLHEFEAFLFVDPEKTAEILGLNDDVEKQLKKIRNAFASPEEIDEGPDSAPSKRINKLYPNYNKPFHGTLAAAYLGMDAIKRECTHFREWMGWLESLGMLSM